ncbi:MAG: putative dsRNA-binding protein [Paracoccaceae bacterium]
MIRLERKYVLFTCHGIKDFAYGKGNTKKNSHQSAAEMMLEQLKIYFD